MNYTHLNGYVDTGTTATNRSLNSTILLHAFDNADVAKYATAQTIFYILYVTIFLLGVFGNCLVCYIVFCNRHMQTVTNYFIMNLALADILLCVLAVPFTPLYFFMGEWIFGEMLCHLLSASLSVSVYVSTLTLTSIAVDRYFAIIYPFKRRLHVRTCCFIVIFIWVISLSATFPYAFYIKQTKIHGRSFCEERWPSESTRRVFSLFTAVMQFVVPFMVILFCYVKISLFMKQRVRTKPGIKNTKKDDTERRRKRRTNRMLIAMVTIFGISWLPMNVIHLIGDYYVHASHWKYYNLCFFISHVIAMSSTCYNPLLYAWLNENFRKEFKLVLPCFKQDSISLSIGTWRSDRACNGNEGHNEEEPFRSRGESQGSIVWKGKKRASSVQISTLPPMDEEMYGQNYAQNEEEDDDTAMEEKRNISPTEDCLPMDTYPISNSENYKLELKPLTMDTAA